MKLQKPKTQKALVLYTVLTYKGELSSFVWVRDYMIYKWASRVGQLEKIYGTMFSRSTKKLIVRTFEKPKTSHYVVYKPIIGRDRLLEIYNEVNK